MFRVSKQAVSALTGSVAMFALGVMLFAQATAPPDKSVPFKSTMANPYRLVESWPKLGSIPPGPAIGIIPDEKGGVWLLHRSDPPLLHIDAAGNVVFLEGFNVDDYRVFGVTRCGDNTDGTGTYTAICNSWTSGYFSASAVPVPAAAWLLAPAVLAAGRFARRRKAA